MKARRAPAPRAWAGRRLRPARTVPRGTNGAAGTPGAEAPPASPARRAAGAGRRDGAAGTGAAGTGAGGQSGGGIAGAGAGGGAGTTARGGPEERARRARAAQPGAWAARVAGAGGSGAGGGAAPDPSAGCGKSGRPSGGRVRSRTITSTTSRPATTEPSRSRCSSGSTPPATRSIKSRPSPRGRVRDELRARVPQERRERVGLQHRPRQKAYKTYDDLMANYCIDKSRVFATGHSSGAQMIVQILVHADAAKHMGFKAVAPVAAIGLRRHRRPIPVMYIQGKMDNVRDSNGADVVARFTRPTSAFHDDGLLGRPSCTSGGTSVNPGCIELPGVPAADDLVLTQRSALQQHQPRRPLLRDEGDVRLLHGPALALGSAPR